MNHPLEKKPARRQGKSSESAVPGRTYQPKRQRRSIKLDRVNPQDFNKMNLRFFCDDCTHFSPTRQACTMGYVAQHTRREQLPLYELTGMMAFCRFIEID